MSVLAVSSDSGRLSVGDTWFIAVETRDDFTTDLTNATVAVTVTRPDTSTSALVVTGQSVGLYTAPYVLAAPGRHTAIATASGVVVGVATFAVEALAVGALPTATEAQTYLQSTGATSFALADIASALAAELAAQSRACRVPAEYPADLREAAYRRVARNLAARAVPVASFTSFDGGGGTSTRVPKTDSEVSRLEGPYRRLVVG